MKFDKNSINESSKHIVSSTSPLKDGKYRCVFLSANWFEKDKQHGRMSVFLRVNDGERKGKTFNANIAFGLVFEGQDNSQAALTKLSALSMFLGSKKSSDAQLWARELQKCAGKEIVVTVKAFSTDKVREGYNLLRVDQA